MHVRSRAHHRLSSLGLADGGFVDNLKRKFFGRPAPAPQPSAQQPARAASAAADPQPPAKPNARAKLGGLNMEALRRREEEAGLKDGGVVPRTGRIRGPGTGTSDSIPARMPVGSFVLPADSTEELADVQVSNGETALAPEVVRRIGAAALMAMRDGTHTPVAKRGASGPGRQHLADGDPVVPVNKPSSFGDAAAVARDSTIAQIPTGMNRAAPIGERVDSSELGRNLSNAAMALPGAAPALAASSRALSTVRGATSGGLGTMGLGNTARVAADGESAAALLRSVPAAPSSPAQASPWTDARQESQAGREIPWGNTTGPNPGEPPAPAPAPYDLANGKDVGFGVKRFDGGSSPLFTNVPNAADNAALMGRGPISAQNMKAADNLAARENERFRGVQAVDQYKREVAEAQAINSRPVVGGEPNGFRRDPALIVRSVAAEAGYNRRVGADAKSQDRALQRDALNTRLESALNSEEGRNMRARWDNDLQRSKLSLEERASSIDARSKLNMAEAEDAFLNAATQEERNSALVNLRALSGREMPRPGYTVVKGERRSDGSADPDMVLGSNGQWMQAPKRPPAAPAVGTVSTVNGRSAVWDGSKWNPR